MDWKLIYLGLWLCSNAMACKSAASKSEPNQSNLVSIGLLEFNNDSRNPNYDYLRGSMRDATAESMDKIFVYRAIPTDKVSGYVSGTKEKAVENNLTGIRSASEDMNADVVIHGAFEIESGKKGDRLKLSINLYRQGDNTFFGHDEVETKVDNKIFDTINDISKRIVQKITDYQKAEIAKSGKQIETDATTGKISLTKESMGIHIFIPPAF